MQLFDQDYWSLGHSDGCFMRTNLVYISNASFASWSLIMWPFKFLFCQLYVHCGRLCQYCLANSLCEQVIHELACYTLLWLAEIQRHQTFNYLVLLDDRRYVILRDNFFHNSSHYFNMLRHSIRLLTRFDNSILHYEGMISRNPETLIERLFIYLYDIYANMNVDFHTRTYLLTHGII